MDNTIESNMNNQTHLQNTSSPSNSQDINSLKNMQDVASSSVDPNNAYHYRVDNIKFKDGKEITPGRLNIFVGANNCGKTQLLKEILFQAKLSPDFIRNHFQVSPVLTESVDFCLPKSSEQLRQTYTQHFNDVKPHDVYYCLSPLLTSKAHTYATSDIAREILSARLIAYLNTESRLFIAKTHSVEGGFNSRSPNNILEELYKRDYQVVSRIGEYVETIFNKKIYFNPHEIGSIGFKFGDDFSNIPDNSIDANKFLQDYPSLDQQGDGIRSTVGILSVLAGSDRPVFLLDEPETFLHPPQAYKLGQIISDIVRQGQQVFIATHSVDFLRGVLSTLKDTSEQSETKIFHLQRQSNSTMVTELPKDVMENITRNPLLSSSRVLDGLFYKGVVATEADADAVFYQRAFSKLENSSDIHFVQCHNKQTLKKVVDPFNKLGIRFAMIADVDIIRVDREFKELLNEFTTQEKTAKLLSLSNSVLECFYKADFSEQLNFVREELKDLLEQDYPDAKAALDIIKSKLSNLSAQADTLGHLKSEGIRYLENEENKVDQQCVDNFKLLLEECKKFGLFIVPVGELESWLTDYGLKCSKRRKSQWILDALEKLNSIEPDFSVPLWIFMKQLKEYMLQE